MAQKITLLELRKTIQTIIKEALEEEPNKDEKRAERAALKKEKGMLSPEKKKEMASWIMRQWFGEKNKGKPWFSEKVTVDNVLDFISNKENKFPYTPYQLENFFKSLTGKKGLQTSMAQLRASDFGEDEAAEGEPEKEPKKRENEFGEKTWEDVSAVTGLTLMGSKVVADRAKEKFVQRYDPEEDSMQDPEEHEERVENAAEKYVALLKASNYDIDAFLDALKKALAPTPFEEPSSAELAAIAILMDILEEPDGEEKAIRLIKKDYAKDNNVLSSFQNTVAKMYTQSRVGRPKKEG